MKSVPHEVLGKGASRVRTLAGHLCLLGLLLCARPGHGADPRQRVPVQVVDVAGGRAYLTPGSKQQIRVGDRVRIGSAQFAVVAVNQRHAVVELEKRRLTRGQRGSVWVRITPAQTLAMRAPPRPLASFAAQWRPPRLPAESQKVRFVPLGPMNDTRRNRAALMLDYQRIQPLSGPAFGIGRTRLRALLHAEMSSLPLRLDADALAELWQAEDLAARPQNASRPLLQVRQLELGYHGEQVQGALGRLRYAARTVGMLDGARVSTKLGDDFQLAAFGGVLPHPLDGSVTTDAKRFGAEAAWQDSDSPAQPRASLTFQGSQYLGHSDERRITGLFEAYPEFGRLGAHAQLSFFDADNPWAAASTELSAAGMDASVRVDSLRLSAAFDLRTPERSLWLAAFLPPGYLCVARPSAGSAGAEPCIGGDRYYTASLNAAWEGALWSLDTGATWTTTRHADAEQATAFAGFHQREILDLLRVDTGIGASRGSLIESVNLDFGLGVTSRDDAADLGLYYRPSLTRYRASLEEFVEHAIGSRWWWAPSEVLDLNGSVEMLTGRDVDVLIVQAGAAWRPRF